MRTNRRVGAIIHKENKILLIHRKKNGSEYWVLPGGGVENRESLEEALKREVFEETSLNLKTHKLIGKEKDLKTGITHILYTVILEKGTPKLGGPEKKESCVNNWHNLEWVDKNTILRLGNVYPQCLKNNLDK